jgi:hypothetical protein
MIEHKPRKEASNHHSPFTTSASSNSSTKRGEREQVGMKLFVFLEYFKGLLDFLVH